MRNRFIEIERFIAACLVLLFHLGVSKGSWIFVEFFLILTGYFTMLHIEKKKDTLGEKEEWYPIEYTLKKFAKIFPYTAISIVAAWAMFLISFDLSAKEAVKWLLCLPTELLLLNGTGMVPMGLPIADGFTTPILMNTHLWYVCSMLFMLPVAMYLLMHSKKAKAILITVLPLFLYGYLIMRDGTISGWHGIEYAFFFLSIRALAGLLLGACGYYVSQWWRKREYTTLGKWLLTIIEVASFVGVAVFSYFSNLKLDALQIGLLFISITLSNAGVTYTSKVSNKNFDFLGAVSLPVYCLQMPIIWICQAILHISNLWLIFVITIVASVVNEVVFSCFGKSEQMWKTKVRKLFIKG